MEEVHCPVLRSFKSLLDAGTQYGCVRCQPKISDQARD